jgi:hypothetical protein
MRPLLEYTALAVELVHYACGYGKGRPEGDPVYDAVTEGRDKGSARRGYSSCADLAHWLYYRLGVRSPWVNRAEHQGWKRGANVWKLAGEAPHVADPFPSTRFGAGDVGIIWSKPDTTDAHVLVVLDDQQPRALYVGEYGQPGGHIASRMTGYNQRDRISIGPRVLHRALFLDVVLSRAEADGELEEAETALDYARRLELPLPLGAEPSVPETTEEGP